MQWKVYARGSHVDTTSGVHGVVGPSISLNRQALEGNESHRTKEEQMLSREAEPQRDFSPCVLIFSVF